MVICYEQYGIKLNIDDIYWLVLYLLKFATEKIFTFAICCLYILDCVEWTVFEVPEILFFD